MANSGFKNSAGVDFDDLFEVSPSLSPSAKDWYLTKGNHEPESRVMFPSTAYVNNAGRDVIDRYMHISTGTPASAAGWSVFGMTQVLNQSNQVVSSVPEEFALADMFAAKGTTGQAVPEWGNTLVTDTTTLQAQQTGTPVYHSYADTQLATAPTHYPTLGYTFDGYSHSHLSGSTTNGQVDLQAVPTLNSDGTINVDVVAYGDAAGTGSSVWRTRVWVVAYNAIGDSQTREYRCDTTLNVFAGGGGRG